MSGKVEEVARAIREADIMSLARREALPIEKIRQYADECQPDYDAMARAAIEAMREPTPEMIEAVEGISVGGPYLGPLDADDIYDRMISAALREEGR